MRFRSTPQKNKFHKLSESTEQLNSGILVSSKDKPDEVSSEAEYVISSSGPVIFDISRKRYGYRFIKRLFDILFSLVVCITLCIPIGILCLVISLDSPGFPIFSQNRVGRFGKPIKVLKLRTMYSDAHSNPEKYFNEEQMKCWLREYKVENDPRVTKIGRFLRKTSLDELPQFLNVLKGDMSVIGCRPITEEELKNFRGIDREYFLSQKMGITGWWQVTDRNSATWEDGTRQEVELYYVRHANLRFDTGIFFETFKAILKKTGK